MEIIILTLIVIWVAIGLIYGFKIDIELLPVIRDYKNSELRFLLCGFLGAMFTPITVIMYFNLKS